VVPDTWLLLIGRSSLGWLPSVTETLTLGRVNEKLFKDMSNNDLNRLRSLFQKFN
jgi:hypothetical protein